MIINSKDFLIDALQKVIDLPDDNMIRWGAVDVALSYGDLRMKRLSWNKKKMLIYSRITGETLITINHYENYRDIARKVLDIVKRS